MQFPPVIGTPLTNIAIDLFKAQQQAQRLVIPTNPAVQSDLDVRVSLQEAIARADATANIRNHHNRMTVRLYEEIQKMK